MELNFPNSTVLLPKWGLIGWLLKFWDTFSVFTVLEFSIIAEKKKICLAYFPDVRCALYYILLGVISFFMSPICTSLTMILLNLITINLYNYFYFCIFVFDTVFTTYMSWIWHLVRNKCLLSVDHVLDSYSNQFTYINYLIHKVICRVWTIVILIL